MDRRTFALVATLTIATNLTALGDAPMPEIGRFKAHVATLASREFAGRRGPGAARAAAYVARELKSLGLEPLFDGRFVQEIPDLATGGLLGRNVGAKLVGSDPALKDQWVVVGAHFDHLGTAGERYFPGADDNASGTAMMLEVARCFAQDSHRPRRSIAFVGFDLEEEGLWGSRYFADHPPLPLDRVKLFVTGDMLGRDLGGVCKDFVFVFGADTSPGLKGFLDQACRGEPLRVGPIGNDLLIVDRSDYGPFRSRSIPYLFFSTGENPDYHRVTDTSDTLNYDKALAATRVILGVLRSAANADRLAPWNGVSEPSMDEAMAVRGVIVDLIANREKLQIGPASMLVLRSTLASLDGIASRGKITPIERTRLVRAARMVMMTVL